MKLMLYNILEGGGARLAKIMAVINKAAADFLVVNEANGFDQGKRLSQFAAKVNFPHYHLSLAGEYDYHAAVFSRYPFKQVVDLKPLRNAGIQVVIKSALGEISLIGAHLTPYTEDDRLPEIALIIKKQEKYQHRVLMGDMNSLAANDRYDTKLVKKFNASQRNKFTTSGRLRFAVIDKITTTGYLDTATCFGEQRTSTVPTAIKADKAHRANMRLDYIFVSDSLKNKLQSYTVIKNPLTEGASDHYPVVVDLKE